MLQLRKALNTAERLGVPRHTALVEEARHLVLLLKRQEQERKQQLQRSEDQREYCKALLAAQVEIGMVEGLEQALETARVCEIKTSHPLVIKAQRALHDAVHKKGGYVAPSPQVLDRLLLDAVKEADQVMCCALLNNKAAPNSTNDRGVTPLHAAVTHSINNSHADIIALLVQEGAHPDTRDADGLTPLFRASTLSREHAVIALLQAKADVTATSTGGSTALHAAAKKRHHTVLQVLCDAGAELDAYDASGCTPLQACCEESSPDMVQRLLDNKADFCQVCDSFDPEMSWLSTARRDWEGIVRVVTSHVAKVAGKAHQT